MKIIITENQFRRLYGEQNTKPQYSWDNYKPDPSLYNKPSDFTGKGGHVERSLGIGDDLRTERIKKGTKKGTITLDGAMESFREALFTPAGMAIEIFLTSFVWTAPSVVGAYAALLSYDIYKSFNGETDWFNIIVDTLCVVTSGAVAGIFAPLVKLGKKGLNSIAKVFEWLKTTSIWVKLKPYLNSLASGISTVSEFIANGLKWIADNTGITLLAKWSSKIVSFFSSIVSGILDVVGKVTGKVVSKITGSAKVGQASSNAAKVGVGQAALNKGIESGRKTPTKVGKDNVTNIKPSQSSMKTASSIKFD